MDAQAGAGHHRRSAAVPDTHRLEQDVTKVESLCSCLEPMPEAVDGVLSFRSGVPSTSQDSHRESVNVTLLGRSSLQVPRLGVGAMTWGDARGLARLHPAKLAYGGAHGYTEEKAALEASLEAGVRLFDTAALYSGGAPERGAGGPAGGTE